MKTLVFITFMIAASVIYAQEITGKWKTFDEETGKEKSIVELYMKNGKLYGKIVKLFKEPNEDQDPICKVCPDDRKNKKTIGMEIIRALEKKDNEWYADYGILDPKNGKIYDCKMWIDPAKPDELQVRGYIAFLYRTQVWKRVKE